MEKRKPNEEVKEHLFRKLKETVLCDMESSSSSGSTKRARAPVNGTQVPLCLVDGCNSDLRIITDAIKYVNSTLRPQRLQLGVRNNGSASSAAGTRILSFTSPHIFSQGAVVSSPWTGAVKAEPDAAGLYNSYSQLNYSDRKNSINPGSLYDNYKGGKQFPFSQGSSSSLLGASISQPLLDANFASSNDSRSQKVFSNGLNQVIDSDCALSLLSSTPTETRQVGLSHMVQSNPIHTGQSLVPSLHYNGFGMEVKENSSALGSSNNNIHCQGMFSIGPHDSDGSSATGPNQTLSFLWE
ncbi:hypothetical protein CFP56_016838 [Quercus suber]|uniref:Uncharacterized protein n=1 Tax=Quercus suber TaxID=58331 RepID=A0AAW0KLG5_QUESU